MAIVLGLKTTKLGFQEFLFFFKLIDLVVFYVDKCFAYLYVCVRALDPLE